MTAKDCGHHDESRKRLYRRLLGGALAFTLFILFLILLVFLILRPSKPHFLLQDATVFAFNLSGPALTATLQVTLAARNPNDRIGIYYDRVDVYVAYHGQQITLPTLLPPTYQGHKDATVWSPFLYGDAVPVAPYLAAALAEDRIAGTLMVNIRVKGRVRWKVGTFISGGYHLYVNCPAYINSGAGGGGGREVAVKYQLIMDCHVDV